MRWMGGGGRSTALSRPDCSNKSCCENMFQKLSVDVSWVAVLSYNQNVLLEEHCARRESAWTFHWKPEPSRDDLCSASEVVAGYVTRPANERLCAITDLTATKNRTTSWTTERQCENGERVEEDDNQKKRCVVEGANSEHVALCLGDERLAEVFLAVLL